MLYSILRNRNKQLREDVQYYAYHLGKCEVALRKFQGRCDQLAHEADLLKAEVNFYREQVRIKEDNHD